jgi:very-short-patch-repair endonuclease
MRTPHAVIVSRALTFRAAPTTTESLLWQELRGSRLGTPFRRQVVLGRYIADFLAPKARLVVEIDGEVHQQRVAADLRRDRDLGRMGYRVLRLPRKLVQDHTAEALAAIRAALAIG